MMAILRQAIFSPAYPFWLLGLFAAWFGVWAIRPSHPRDFLLEHVFTAAFVIFLCWNHRHFRLSNLSYTMIFVFMCLHVVGAHYTYAEVPYDAWLRRLGAWLGAGDISLETQLGFERNHFDRLVHFCFGLLMAYPVREVFVRIVQVRGFWGYYLPLDVMMSFSLLYELIEWGVVMVAAADVGQTYLGTQGDEWDAHKDTALATLGGLIAMTVTAIVNWHYRRDFGGDLTGRGSAPLGEVRIAEMLEAKAQTSASQTPSASRTP